jgi:ATP adenylyltransferase
MTKAVSETSIEKSTDFVGENDGFERLWVPHRMAYVSTPEENRGKEGQVCPFCEAPSKTDQDALIVARGETAYVILNLFPYNTAHLMICPYRHISLYEDLTITERDEISALTAHALKTIRTAIKPDGFNLGLNQGEVSGAGIAAHLHQHIVPRWSGDSNFFPIIAKTRAIPTLLGDIRDKLEEAWQKC